MSIGTIIAENRKRLGMTQEALSQQLGVTNQAVSKWESEQSCPDIQLLPQIADIFGMSIDELFGRAPKQLTEVEIVEEPKQEENAPRTELPWEDDGVLRVVLYVGHTLVGSIQHTLIEDSQYKNISFEYEGPALNVESALSVTCSEVAGNVTAGGDVNCGEVGGSITASGDVNCDTVQGHVNAEGDVDCDEVAGNVSAGGDVDCGEVAGNVSAGGDVDCGEVSGSVNAGGDVDCENIMGNVTAGGDVSSEDTQGKVFSGIFGKGKGKKGFTITIGGDDDDDAEDSVEENDGEQKKKGFTFRF